MDIFDDTELFPYLEGRQLDGRDVTYTIRAFRKQEMPDGKGNKELKSLLVLQETPKLFVLNKTNALAIYDLYGRDIEKWPGKRITVYPLALRAFGKDRISIRIRPVAPPPVTTAQKAAVKQKTAEKMVTTNGDLFGGDSPATRAGAVTPGLANGNGVGNPRYNLAPTEEIDWARMAIAANHIDGFCAAVYQIHAQSRAFSNAVGVKNAYASVIGDYNPGHNAAALDALGVLAALLERKEAKSDAISAAVRRFTELMTPETDDNAPEWDEQDTADIDLSALSDEQRQELDAEELAQFELLAAGEIGGNFAD